MLCVVGLALNADWCKPQFETALSQLFHRKVRLGHMSWSFGFNGLAIATNKVEVDEMNDAPFLRAQRTEIGVSFRPLLKGDVELHHLDFRKPEFWFTREMNGDWNFADLIKFGPDVRIIQINDAASTSRIWRPLLLIKVVLISIKCSSNLSGFKKKVSKPFFLSFELKQPKYLTQVRIGWSGRRSYRRLEEQSLHNCAPGPAHQSR